MIGRLPNRSDRTPSKGEKKNCISAKTTANRALHFAASVIWPPRKSRISLGSTGMIKPIARMSRVTVTRMKMTAAGRDFMRTEHERNVVGAVVSTTAARALGTSASTTNLLRWFGFPIAENESAREHHGWIGWKARPLLRIRYGSEDDIGNRRRRRYQAGKPHANALRTTRSTLAILCDEAALLPLGQNGSAGEQNSRARSICHRRHCQKRNRRRERRAHC